MFQPIQVAASKVAVSKVDTHAESSLGIFFICALVSYGSNATQAAFRGATAADRLGDFEQAAKLCRCGLQIDPALPELKQLSQVSLNVTLMSFPFNCK